MGDFEALRGFWWTIRAYTLLGSELGKKYLLILLVYSVTLNSLNAIDAETQASDTLRRW